MKQLVLIIFLITACGDSSRGSELIGQIKKVVENTPVLCSDYVEADVSLGIMRNGVGSMSTDDVSVVIPSEFVDKAKDAARTGNLVKIIYDERRVAACWPDRRATHLELLTPEDLPLVPERAPK